MSYHGGLWIIIFTSTLINLTAGQQWSSRRKENSCEQLNSPGKEYLLDPDSRKCYLIGSRGPCGELMTFYKHPFQKDAKIGFCDCELGHVDKNMPCKDSPIRRRLYSNKDDRCYTVFSQGPCRKGEWLVLNEAGNTGTCVRNQCLTQENNKGRDTNDQFWFFDLKRRQCYKTYTQGYCPKGMQLELIHDSQYPKCKAPTCQGSLAYGIKSSLTCRTGSRFSLFTNSCRTVPTRSKSSYTIG